MSHGYRLGLTLDRVCNNRGYSPGNCRWVTRKAQAYNRRTNTRLTIDGMTRTLTEWSHIAGIESYVIVKRIQSGWTPKDAVFTEKRQYKKK